MTFIKSIWNKVKAFFGNLFGSKKVVAATVAAPTAVAPAAKNEAAKAAEVVATTEAEVAAAERAEKLAIIFNRIAQVASFRNFSLEEAKAAYLAGDEVGLVRIEKAMNVRLKAGKKNSKAKRAA
jgi:hypothetical protein